MFITEIIGNLGADAEHKHFNNKTYVALSVAVSQFDIDSDGNRNEKTLWVSVLWYGTGGNLFAYLKKGVKVFIRGKQRIRLYKDRHGLIQYGVSINASELQVVNFLKENNPTQENISTGMANPIPSPGTPESDIHDRLDSDDNLPF